MALRLRVVSEHRRSLGERSTVVFGVGGGTVGRAPDNDWVLPDSQRYVSSRHARIQFRQGDFVLRDLSTNGIFVNDREKGIGRQSDYVLKDGDLVRIGEYEVLVTIDAATDFPPDQNALVALDVLGAATNTYVSTDRDIGASLNVVSLLANDDSGSGFRAVNAFGQAVVSPLNVSRDSMIDRHSEAVARRVARLARAARKQEMASGNGSSSPAALYDVHNGLTAFCRGAGIDADKLPPDAQVRVLHLAGQLLREALLGLKDLDRAQQERRNRLRVETPPATQDQPFELSRGGLDDLLSGLLGSHDSRRIDAVQWLRERFHAAKRHESAESDAFRAAFVEFVDRLDPVELQPRFERALKRGKTSSSQPAKYWELYGDFYRNLTEMPAESLPHVFVEAFAKAYLAEMQRDDKAR